MPPPLKKRKLFHPGRIEDSQPKKAATDPKDTVNQPVSNGPPRRDSSTFPLNVFRARRRPADEQLEYLVFPGTPKHLHDENERRNWFFTRFTVYKTVYIPMTLKEFNRKLTGSNVNAEPFKRWAHVKPTMEFAEVNWTQEKPGPGVDDDIDPLSSG